MGTEQTQPSMNALDRALHYAETGWPVFPCSPANKQPLVAQGFKSASTDFHQVRQWWGAHPDAMIGVPTGVRSGVWVLDVDTKNGDGFAELAELVAANDALPPTVTVRTPSGGKHYLFQFVDGVRNRGKVSPNIDVRGEGGYVIAPGSVTDEGTFYDWAEKVSRPARAPAWLFERVIKRGSKVKALSAVSEPNTRYVEAAIVDELSKLARVSHGRNNALNDAAFALGTFVGAGALSEPEAESRLFGAALANGYVGKDGEHAARQTIKSGIASGRAKPRKIPEAATRHDDGLDEAELATEGRAIAADLVAGFENTAEAIQAVAEAVTATPYIWRDPTTLPRREWLYAKHYVRKYLSLTVAPGGVGKSSLALAEAITMVRGIQFLNDAIQQDDLRVWYFNGEDDRDELARRIQAFCKRWNIEPEHTNGRLFIDTGREQEFVVMREIKRDVVIAVPIVEAIKRQIIANKIDVLIVDPFVSTHTVNENDNGAIDRVAKLWQQIADECNCSVEVVHHSKKTGDREVEAEDSRGASALLAAARAVRQINRMTTKQADAAGIDHKDRFGYVNVTRGKANMGPMEGSLTWRKIESVSLDNTGSPGDILQSPDMVGVMTPWEWPDADEAADGVPADKAAAIMAGLAAGRYGESDNAGDWAGHVVGEHLKLQSGKGEPGRARVRAILRAWVKSGRLEVIKEKPTPSARERPFLVPVEVAE